MFNLGDIVKPRPFCLGHNYLFKVISKKESLDKETFYELEGIIQRLNPINGSKEEQLKEIKALEDALWDDSSLELIESTSEIKTSLIDKKEENEMQILDIYKERKNQLLMDEFYKNKKEIMKEDEIQKIQDEMINQINIILDNEGRNEKFEILAPEFHKNMVTKQTEEKLNKIEMELDSEKDKLYNTIQEVKALFELTDDYNERMKILKRYDIINKEGKLNV